MHYGFLVDMEKEAFNVGKDVKKYTYAFNGVKDLVGSGTHMAPKYIKPRITNMYGGPAFAPSAPASAAKVMLPQAQNDMPGWLPAAAIGTGIVGAGLIGRASGQDNN